MNHDSTSGTVDLFSKTTLTNGTVQYSDTNGNYNNSNLDKYLEGTVYDGFNTDIKNALNAMDIINTDNVIIKRHVVAPSGVEMGIDWPHLNILPGGGSVYPIFGPACNPNPKSIYYLPNDYTKYDPVQYWTRTVLYTDNTKVWCVIDQIPNDGTNRYAAYIDSFLCSIKLYIVARIRFSKK